MLSLFLIKNPKLTTVQRRLRKRKLYNIINPIILIQNLKKLKKD